MRTREPLAHHRVESIVPGRQHRGVDGRARLQKEAQRANVILRMPGLPAVQRTVYAGPQRDSTELVLLCERRIRIECQQVFDDIRVTVKAGPIEWRGTMCAGGMRVQ